VACTLYNNCFTTNIYYYIYLVWTYVMAIDKFYVRLASGLVRIHWTNNKWNEMKYHNVTYNSGLVWKNQTFQFDSVWCITLVTRNKKTDVSKFFFFPNGSCFFLRIYYAQIWNNNFTHHNDLKKRKQSYDKQYILMFKTWCKLY